MRSQLKKIDVEAVRDVEAARKELRLRALDKIDEDFGRLVYLASTRDHISGAYHDDVLASLFSESAAASALSACHQEIFHRLAICDLQPLVSQLERYLRSPSVDPHKTLHTLETLDRSSTLIPSACHPVIRELFLSNVRVSLAILEHRRSPSWE
jgi:hypothetical protein